MKKYTDRDLKDDWKTNIIGVSTVFFLMGVVPSLGAIGLSHVFKDEARAYTEEMVTRKKCYSMSDSVPRP